MGRFAFLMLLLSFAARGLAQAQQNYYSVAYSGGSCLVTNGSPGGPYTLNNGSWGNGGTGQTASCSGTITATFTWVGPDPAPAKAVVTQTCSSGAWAYTGSASSADGLGDSPVVQTTSIPPYVSSNSSGTHYSLVNGGASVSVQCSPSCSGSGSVASAGVGYSATCQPLSVSLTGPVRYEGALHVAVGQSVRASVSSPVAASGDEYSWAAPGENPFANYQVSTSGGVFTPFALPPTTSSSMSFYFGKAGTATVECLYYSFLLNATIDLTTQVTVDGPARTNYNESCGTMQLLSIAGTTLTVWAPGGATPTGFWLWGAVDENGHIWGCHEHDTLSDPAFLSEGSGSWTYAQVKGGYVTTDGARTDFSGIDGTFPYPHTAIYSASHLEQGGFDDRPGADWTGVLSRYLPLTVDHDQEFQLFIFYKPPDDAAGASVYVPKTRFNWNATGACASADGIGWTQSDRSSGFHVTTDYPWPFPIW